MKTIGFVNPPTGDGTAGCLCWMYLGLGEFHGTGPTAVMAVLIALGFNDIEGGPWTLICSRWGGEGGARTLNSWLTWARQGCT